MNTFVKPLSDTELDQLDEFLLDRIPNAEQLANRDSGVLCISELHGYFTILASIPVTVETEQWLPVIWGDFPPEWKDEKHALAKLNLFRRFKHEVAESLCTPGFVFDPCFNERTENGKTEIMVRDWCNGYQRGSQFLPEEGDYLNDPEFSSPTMVIKANTLIDGVDVLALMAEKDPAGAARIRNSVPEAARDLYSYWASARETEQASQPKSNVPYVAQPLTSRNNPCPCGSGKKYKRCCLH